MFSLRTTFPDRVLRHLQDLLFILGGIVLAVNLIISWSDQRQYPGVDLRPKVVGARSLLSGRDPYTYVWRPSEGEYFLDPTIRQPGPNANTYSPATLLFIYAPTCWMKYSYVRTFYFFAEWAALFASIYMLSKAIHPSLIRRLFVLIAVFFFANSNFFRLHVERGQYYVFLLFIGSLSYFLYQRGGRSRLWGMAVLGFLAAFRPTYALIAVPLWFLRFRKESLIFLISSVFICLLTLPVGGLRVWKRYFENVEVTRETQLNPALKDQLFGPEQEVPKIAEGFDFRLRLAPRSTSTTFTQFIKPRLSGDPANQMHFPAFHAHLDETKAIQWILAIDRALVGVLVVLFALLAWINRGRVNAFQMALLIGVVLAMDTDYFLPQRYSYVDILFLWPLALSIPILFYRPRFMFIPSLLIWAGILFGHSIVPTTEWSFITSLRSVLMMSGFNILVIASLWLSPAALKN